MADLYTVVHCDAGPLATFTTREDAERELARVVRDEPTWADDVWVEPFQVGEVDESA